MFAHDFTQRSQERDGFMDRTLQTTEGFLVVWARSKMFSDFMQKEQ